MDPFPPSPICGRAYDLAQPYLRSLALDCNYRFYAPNPGADPLLWVRLHYENGRTRCFEWPSLGDPPPPGIYLRDLSIPAHVTPPNPDEAGDSSLPAVAERILSSYARYIARNSAGPAGGKNGPLVKSPLVKIDVFSTSHALLSPEQARLGWQRCDLRLHDTILLGSFTADGLRIGPNVTTPVPIGELAAEIIASDIQPLLEPKGEPIVLPKLFAKERTPLAIRHLLNDHHDLLTTTSVDLLAAIERALRVGNNPEDTTKLVSQ
jgi:hypothetical protein